MRDKVNYSRLSGQLIGTIGEPIIACDSAASVVRANLSARRIARQLGTPSVTTLLPDAHTDLTVQCLKSGKAQTGASSVGGRSLSWTYRPLRRRNLICAYGTLLTRAGARSSFETSLLKRALANLAVGVLIVDADLAIHYANPHAQTLIEANWPGATKERQLFHEMPWLQDELRPLVLRGDGAATISRNAGQAPVEIIVNPCVRRQPGAIR